MGGFLIGIKSLKTKKSRDELGVFLVEGEKFVKEIPVSYRIVQYIVSDGYRRSTEALKNRANVLEVNKALLDRVAQTASPQGILAVVEKKHYTYEEASIGDGFVLVCECINDPGNLGSLIRTAAAAEASCVVLTHGSASVWNPKVQRASAGAALNLPVAEDIGLYEVAKHAKKHNIPLYAAHQRSGILPFDLDLSKKFCLILGSESHGLSETAEKLADALIRLPMSANVESLSVAAAGSIIMYESVRQKNSLISAPESLKEGNKPLSV